MKGNMAFINEFHLSNDLLTNIQEGKTAIQTESIPSIPELSLNVKGLLTEHEVNHLNHELNTHAWIPVGIDGIKAHYKEGDTIGSYRLSCYEEALAQSLWMRLQPLLPTVRQFNEQAMTDWDQHESWEPIGINPLFRFIRYTQSGLLIPHYDGPYIQDEDVRSLSTLVLYLTDNHNGGGTRFLKDSQAHLPESQRNYADWTREATEKEVSFIIEPAKGDALIFDHRVLHDSERINENRIKTIIRTDIMYRKVN